MARMNISLPDELRRRMREHDNDTNWSAIAVDAFRKKVEMLEFVSKEDFSMNDAVTRLRAARREAHAGHYELGFRSGRDWAMKKAEWEELIRLKESFPQEFDWNQFFQHPDAVGYEGLFVRWVIDESASRGSGIQEFWLDTLARSGPGYVEISEESFPTESYVQGFAEGALEVLEEAEEQM